MESTDMNDIQIPRKKTSKFKIIFLPLIAAFLVLLIAISIIMVIISGSQFYYMKWGVSDITFYSQIPLGDDVDKEVWNETINIDGGFNDSVYEGSYEYSKYKNEELNIESQIGVADSLEWSAGDDAYIGGGLGLDAQYQAGAKTIVTSGFNLASAFEILYKMDGYMDQDFKENGWQSIVLDDSGLAVNHPSAISVYYDGADAGFLAGIAASVYTLDRVIQDYEAGKEINDDVVTWGGTMFDTVYAILSGFEQGVNYFNYKVLGVDVNDNIVAPTEGDTLGLISSLGITDEDLVNGLDLNNGYDLEVSYNGEASNDWNNLGLIGTESFYKNGYKDSWYVGGFESSIDSDQGKIAYERANLAIDNGTYALFPVAGGQYLSVADAFSMRQDESTHNKVIAVDVDGTESDPSHSEYYLGSATKNIKDSASLAIWFSDGMKGSPNFNGINGEDFVTINSDENQEGWAVDTNGDGEFTTDSLVEEENDAKLFRGTYNNGGIGFTEGNQNSNGKSTLQNSYESIVTTFGLEGVAPETFMEFANLAYDENLEVAGGIENSSTTFTQEGTSTLLAANAAKWIPNWNTYK